VEDEGMIEKIKAEVKRMKEKTGLSLGWILRQLGVGRSTYYRWEGWRRPEKRGFVHPLKPLKREEEAVLAYAQGHPGIGYKKLTWQMVDEDVVALTLAQVYRILSRAHLLDRWGRTVDGASPEYKEKPTRPNEHWHTDLMYIKVLGMWCFLIAVLDGFSRYVVGWKVLLDMTAQSVSLFMQEVIDRVGCELVKLIHDNGSQLISRDFREVLLSANIQQIRIRRNHPQSNGKAERFIGLVRQECLRPHSPVTILEVEKVIGEYIDDYNHRRLHSALEYMRPVDYYKGDPALLRAQREEKLRLARERRLAENREFNRRLKLQSASYFKTADCPI
jgi:transposase InsO family protein